MSQINRIVNISISQATSVPSMPSFNIPLIAAQFLITSVTPNFTTRTALYTSLSAIATQFGTSSPVYNKVASMLSQNPSIQQFMVGRMETGGDGSESWTAALTAMAAENNVWYGLIACDNTLADQKLIADWVESNAKLCVLAASDPNIPTSATSDIGYYLATTKKYYRTGVFYDPLANAGATGDDNVDAAMIGQAFPFNPGQRNWAFVQLVGATPIGMGNIDTQVGYILGKNANCVIPVAGVNIVQNGTTGVTYFDIEWGLDWLAARIQNRILTALTQAASGAGATPGKIAFTDQGIGVINGQLAAALAEAMQNNILQNFTTTVPLAASISLANKQARTVPGITFTGQLASAVDVVTITGTVTY